MYKMARYAVAIVLALAAMTVIAPRDAAAETVGVIMTKGSEFSQRAHNSLLAYLKDKGYGTRVQFIVQTPFPDPVAWSNAARKLIAADVSVIISYGTAPTLALVREQHDMPIIYAGIYQPIAEKIRSRSVTGVCIKPGISSLMRYMHDSGAQNPATVLYCSAEDDSREELREFQALAEKYKFVVTGLDIRKPADFANSMANITSGTVFITGSQVIETVYKSIIRTLTARHVPTASLIASDNPSPVLSVSTTPEKNGHEAGRRLVAFLEGGKQSEIPMSCLSDNEVVYNLKDAQDMGIKVPMSILNDATRIIK